MSDGKVQYEMTMEAARFASALQASNAALGQGIGFIQRHAAALASLAGVSLSVGGVFAGFKDALEMGGKLSDLSAQTGQSVGDLVVLRQAFENAGLSADQVGPSINLMQKALAGVSESGEPTNKIFERLGLNMNALKSSSATDALGAISERISALPTAAERAEAAMKIFGRSGGQMLALLSDKGALGDAAAMVGGQAALLQRNAQMFDRASDILGSVGTKLRGFFVGFADKLAPSLMPAIEALNKVDLSGLGQRAADALNTGIAAFKSGDLGKVLTLAVEVAALKAVNLLSNAFITSVGVFGAALAGAIVGASKMIASPDFWKGTLHLGTGLWGELIAGLTEFKAKFDATIGGGLKQMGAPEGAIPALINPLGAAVTAATGVGEAAGQQITMDTARAIAKEETTKAITPLAKGVGDAVKAGVDAAKPGVQEAIAGFGKSNLVSPERIKAAEGALDSLLSRLKTFTGEEAPNAEQSKRGAAGETPPAEKAERIKIEADAWTKIGRFVGENAGGPAMNWQQRIHDLNKKSNEINAKVLDKATATVAKLEALVNKTWTVNAGYA